MPSINFQKKSIAFKNIKNENFTRVLRADPARKGLLYEGTESGLYISFDDGNSWNSFQLNLPIVPITDLTIKSALKKRLIKEKSVLLARPKLCVAISASIQSFLIKICH